MSRNSIAESSAVSLSKVLPQHHTAITILDNILNNYTSQEPFDWLDLACGRGQIIAHLEDTLPDVEKRAKIRYFGYDINNSYAREAEKRGKELKLKEANVKVGTLDDFSQLTQAADKYSFVTFTNAIHELKPSLFGTLLLELLLRLKPGATLYIYDMENLPEPELGAIPWDANEVRRLLTYVFTESGATLPPPTPQRWPHTSCMGWSLNLQRDKLDVDAETLAQKFPELSAKTSKFIEDLYRTALQQSHHLCFYNQPLK